MATLAVCEKCKNVYNFEPKVTIEGGTQYTVVKCTHCGNEIKRNTSHIHYGEDGKK